MALASLFLSDGWASQRSNSGCHAWWEVSLSGKASCQPKEKFSVTNKFIDKRLEVTLSRQILGERWEEDNPE